MQGLRGAAGFPREIYALFFVRLVVSAGSFVYPFLAMMLTMKLGYDESKAGVFLSSVSVVSAAGLLLGGKLGDSPGPETRSGQRSRRLRPAVYAVCALDRIHRTPRPSSSPWPWEPSRAPGRS